MKSGEIIGTKNGWWTCGDKFRQIWSRTVWPDWAIFCFLGKHSKLVAAIILPKSLTLIGNFCKRVQIIHFIVKSFFGHFYGHLAIFYWSHWSRSTSVKCRRKHYWLSCQTTLDIAMLTGSKISLYLASLQITVGAYRYFLLPLSSRLVFHVRSIKNKMRT